MRTLAILALLADCACVTAGAPSSPARQASDRPNVVFSEETGERTMRLAIATAIRADRSAADAAFAQTPAELAREAAQLARAKGHKAYAILDERVFEQGIERRSLDVKAREPQALVREWIVEFGDPARPRSDGRAWLPLS